MLYTVYQERKQAEQGACMVMQFVYTGTVLKIACAMRQKKLRAGLRKISLIISLP